MNLLSQIKEIITIAQKEDSSDLTSRLLFTNKDRVKASVVCKQNGVLCGIDFAAITFRKYDPACRLKVHKEDGEPVKKGETVMEVEGRTAAILSAERKAVNFIQHFSGVATLTAQYVRAVKGTRTHIYDTRKTIPGIRLLQKYAVRCGGGRNHRMNLKEMAMVKDNHIAALGKRLSSVLTLKERLPAGTLLEIEAKTMREVRLALNAKADIIMLDNMPPAKLNAAVRWIRKSTKAQIEVSGGVTLKDARRIARLGVERISVGALTHSAQAMDFSLEAESFRD